MSQRYNRIMEHIAVTEEMRCRVLARLAGAPLDRTTSALRRLRPALTAAACIVLLLLGSAALPRFWNSDQSEDAQSAVSDIQEWDSAGALSEAVGFSVPEPEQIPFSVAQQQYVSYWGELAEITFTGTDGQTLTFRVSPGEEDNSGVYEEFSVTSEQEINGITVTLRGNADGWLLAVWTQDGYAYSVSLSRALPETQWQPLLEELIGGD